MTENVTQKKRHRVQDCNVWSLAKEKEFIDEIGTFTLKNQTRLRQGVPMLKIRLNSLLQYRAICLKRVDWRGVDKAKVLAHISYHLGELGEI